MTTTPDILSFKAATGTLSIDEMQGIVECFVAAVGNKDSVGDIVLPGAFDGSLKRRKPRVVWGHDWNQPIGKVIEIYEVAPTDRRLPSKMRDAGVGGVYARVQFNLKSERGREAFNSVVFFGEDQEWSIGYKTLDSIYDQKRQANLLKELELYEVSPVLHGANQLTATISIKSDSAEEGKVDSFQKSKWKKFDPEFAEMIRSEHPEIWRLGGNIKGNDQYRALKPVSDRGGKATSQAEVNALELREAWVARHYEDFRPAGVMAQIKWLAVGSRGEAYMKRVIREEIAKRSPQGKMDSSPSENPETRDEKAKDEIAKALSERFGGMSRIAKITPQEVIFEHAPNADAAIEGKWTRFAATYSVTESGDYKIGPAVVAQREEDADKAKGKGASPDDLKVGMVVTWKASGGQAYGKIVRSTAKGSIEAVPEGPIMEGTPENPAYAIQVWKMNNGEWNATDTTVVHRAGSLTPIRQLPGSKSGFPYDEKAPIPADAIPQERITGDVLRGYGPRRGNLERLLRYWRPIMRKPGGFRRCRVILADHPELYPLNNICAWLHHETTGLWPNEGCHHPGMKNCRRKLKNVVRGSIWSDDEFENRLRSRLKKDASGNLMDYAPAERDYIKAMLEIVSTHGRLADGDDSGIYVGYTPEAENEDARIGIKCENCAFYRGKGMCRLVDQQVEPGGKCRLAAIDYDSVRNESEDDETYLVMKFNEALREFMDEEPEFFSYMMDDKNWEHVGDDEKGYESPHRMMMDDESYEDEDGDEEESDEDEEDGDEEEYAARMRRMMTRRWGQQESKPGGCGCGCGDMKSAQEQKVGRVLSSRNLQKVQQAMTLLQEVIASSGEDIQMKHLTVPALADEIKSAIEPVADYYDLSVKVFDYGVDIAGFDHLSEDAKSAINNALSHATGKDAYVIIETEPTSMMSLKSLVDEIIEGEDIEVVIDEAEGKWLAVQAATKALVDKLTETVSGSSISFKSLGMGEMQSDCGCDE